MPEYKEQSVFERYSKEDSDNFIVVGISDEFLKDDVVVATRYRSIEVDDSSEFVGKWNIDDLCTKLNLSRRPKLASKETTTSITKIDNV